MHSLHQEIKDVGLRFDFIASQIGMSKQMLCDRLKGRRPLKPDDEKSIKKLIRTWKKTTQS